jgi:hypothetical protein
LALEAASGLSWLTHQQDLAVKVLRDNLSALLCLEALDERDGPISEDTPTSTAYAHLPTFGSACRGGCAMALRLPSML